MVRGRRRALAGAVLLDLAVSPLFTWGAVRDRLAQDLGVAGHALDVAYAVGLAAFTTGVLLGGRVADRVAPRRLALVVAAGLVAGLTLVAGAGSVAQVVLGHGVLVGGATGLGYATAVRVAAAPSGRRGTALALVVSAYAAGAVVLAPVLDLAWAQVGRAATFAGLAVLLGAAALVAAVLLPARGTGTGTVRRSRGSASVLAGHRRPVLGAWAMFALGSAPALVAFGHAGGLAGASAWAVTAVVLLNAGNLGGRLLVGPVADRVGHAPALHATALTAVGAALVLALAGHPAATLGALLALGLQYGAVSVLVPMAVAEAVPVEGFGTAYGLVFSGWGLVGLAGPLAAGRVADGTGYPAVAAALVVTGLLFWASVWTWGRAATPRRATTTGVRRP